MLIKNEISPQKFVFLEYDYNEKLLQKKISVSPLLCVQDYSQSSIWHTTTKKPRKLSFSRLSVFKRRRLPTLPHCIAVPSAQAGLTSLFGMGRGGTLPQ